MTIEPKRYAMPDLIRLPFRCAPLLCTLIALQTLVSGAVPTLQVLASAAFIDTALAVVGGRAAVEAIYPPIAAVVALIAYMWIAGGLMKFAEVRLELAARTRFRTAIVEKRARLAYRHVEDHETWDLISRVAKEPEQHIKAGYTDLMALVSTAMQVAGVLVLLLAHVWWAALAILAFSVPMMALAVKSGRANYEVERETSKFRRKYEYLSEVLSGRETAEERALFGFTGRLNRLFKGQFESARRIEVRAQRRWFIKMKAGSLLFALVSIFIALILLQPVLAGAITIGLFMSLVNAVFSMVQMMSWGITHSMDQLARHREYLKDLTAFSELEETPGAEFPPATPPPAFDSLELRDVRFRYPGTDHAILSGLTMEIRAGKRYAFVGVNGAGKTTVTKLIMGLYGDYEGEILLNGRPLASYAQNELKSFLSVVYQDFARYSVSLADNIALGDVNGMGNDGARGAVEQAAGQLGLADAAEALPKGLDTPLGKIREDGQDLSGGQWQRVAMARAVMSPAPLILLDEPTASMDPIGESRLYEQFDSISRGRTTIFISHRLGSTKLADHIFVIGDGRVAEQGTHRELMELGGEYARMYESQRSWYE